MLRRTHPVSSNARESEQGSSFVPGQMSKSPNLCLIKVWVVRALGPLSAGQSISAGLCEPATFVSKTWSPAHYPPSHFHSPLVRMLLSSSLSNYNTLRHLRDLSQRHRVAKLVVNSVHRVTYQRIPDLRPLETLPTIGALITRRASQLCATLTSTELLYSESRQR